jgi:hypothetical protein
LSIAEQNQRREVGAGHASTSSRLLGVEASLTRVSQSGLKTGGYATTGGARGTITEVALEADGSIRRTVSDSAILHLLFSMYYAIWV